MLDAYPSLQKMYKADDGNTEVFYFENACPFSFFNIDISSFLLSNFIILNEILTTMHNPLYLSTY